MMIVQLLLPFFIALINIIGYNTPFSFYMGLFAALINIGNSSYNECYIYNFGGWNENIGISHIFTIYKTHISLIIHILFLLYYLLYSRFLLQQKPIFFTILSLLYFGILGMLFTNDLFNLYVFLEVISLCCVILISYKQNYKAALEYLIYGSFFATISLLSIAIIMFNQKTLNISILQKNASLLSEIAINTFLFGLIGKIGLYICKLYKSNELTYKKLHIKLMPIISLSSCILLYKISEFIHLSSYPIWIIMLCIINNTYAGYLASKEKDIRNLFFYSIMSSNGYILLAIIYTPQLSTCIIINEFIVKFFLFYTLAYIQTDKVENLYLIKHFKIIYWCLLFTIFSSAGLPITNGFFIKISILQSIISAKHYAIFIATICTMGISINYHWRMLYHIYLLKHEHKHSLNIWKTFIMYIYLFFIIFGSLIYLNIID